LVPRAPKRPRRAWAFDLASTPGTRSGQFDCAGSSPELLNRSLFSRCNGSPVYRLHGQEKRIGRGRCRKPIDETVGGSLAVQRKRLPVAPANLRPPFSRRFFKSLNDKLPVFHPQAPNLQIPNSIPIDHADNKLTQLWCYGVDGFGDDEAIADRHASPWFCGSVLWGAPEACLGPSEIRTVETSEAAREQRLLARPRSALHRLFDHI